MNEVVNPTTIKQPPRLDGFTKELSKKKKKKKVVRHYMQSKNINTRFVFAEIITEIVNLIKRRNLM